MESDCMNRLESIRETLGTGTGAAGVGTREGKGQTFKKRRAYQRQNLRGRRALE